MVNVNHSYAGLWQLYSQIQNVKIQHINPAEIFNSRLQDSFMHIDLNGAELTGIYSRKGNMITIPEREITDAIVDAVNFDNVYYPGGWPTDVFDRFKAFTAALPPVRPERAIPLEAVNNRVTLESGNYYKTTDYDGKTRVLACKGYKLAACTVDVRAGRTDSEIADVGKFWRDMAEGEPFTKVSGAKQAAYLEAAGVQPGFFTVASEYGEHDYYFNPDSKRPVMRRDEYDATWNGLHCEGWHQTPGDILRCADGREFVVNADGKIDVEYGDDMSGLYPIEIIGNINDMQ